MQTGTHAEIVEVNTVSGNKHLADIFILYEHLPLELIYPLTVTRSAIFIRGREVGWQFEDEELEGSLLAYLKYVVQSIREEIYIEVCDPEPDLPGYPYVDYHPDDYPVVIGIDEAVEEGEIEDDALHDVLLAVNDLPEMC